MTTVTITYTCPNCGTVYAENAPEVAVETKVETGEEGQEEEVQVYILTCSHTETEIGTDEESGEEITLTVPCGYQGEVQAKVDTKTVNVPQQQINVATRSTTFNVSYTKESEVEGEEPVTVKSVAIQTAVGQTGYVLYAGDTAGANTIYTMRSAGNNAMGQLGINRPRGMLPASRVSQQVLAGDANPEDLNAPIDNIMFIATSANGGSVAAYDNNHGTVYGWGNNAKGQVGDGTFANRTVPAMVTMDGGGAYLDVSSVLLRDEDGTLRYGTTPKYNATVLLTGYNGDGINVDDSFAVGIPTTRIRPPTSSTLRRARLST